MLRATPLILLEGGQAVSWCYRALCVGPLRAGSMMGIAGWSCGCTMTMAIAEAGDLAQILLFNTPLAPEK